MKKGFRILKFKKDKPIFEVKDVSKSFDGRPILKKLSVLCSRNVTYNTYHDSHHFKSVIIIACLLAKLSNLKKMRIDFF